MRFHFIYFLFFRITFLMKYLKISDFTVYYSILSYIFNSLLFIHFCYSSIVSRGTIYKIFSLYLFLYKMFHVEQWKSGRFRASGCMMPFAGWQRMTDKGKTLAPSRRRISPVSASAFLRDSLLASSSRRPSAGFLRVLSACPASHRGRRCRKIADFR